MFRCVCTEGPIQAEAPQLLCYFLLSGKPLFPQGWKDFKGEWPTQEPSQAAEQEATRQVGVGTKEAFRDRSGQGKGIELENRRKSRERG